MRSLRLLLLLALAVSIAAIIVRHPSVLDARGKLRVAGRSGSSSGAPTAVGLRELDFPYYDLRDGFSSELDLVSDSPKPTDLTIAIYSQRGASVLPA